MDSRIQFRIDEETKRLAQQLSQRQGKTLSESCREFAEQLAQQQRDVSTQEAWLKEQINLAFKKFDAGFAVFIDNDQVQLTLAERKDEISNQ